MSASDVTSNSARMLEKAICQWFRCSRMELAQSTVSPRKNGHPTLSCIGPNMKYTPKTPAKRNTTSTGSAYPRIFMGAVYTFETASTMEN